MTGGISHFDSAPSFEFEVGHLRGRWTDLGRAARSIGVGVRRIQVPSGFWSTPAHEHEEEIFYVLGGRGLSWQDGHVCEIGAGDCIVYLERRGAHTLHSLEDLDVLAFGPRVPSPSVSFPRLGRSLVGGRWIESEPGARDGQPVQFVVEAELGPPELPDQPGERPRTVVNVADVEPQVMERPRIARTRRDLGVAAGSVRTGVKHIDIRPGKLSAPLHCHSLEHELFVILDGDGLLMLDDEETAVGPGHVVARPAGTEVSHTFRAGAGGMAMLAYGTREMSENCYYPTSNKIMFGGLGVIARLERLDYWDGED